MPKGTVEYTVGKDRRRKTVRTKHKIGGRKSTVSAADLSSDKLLEMLEVNRRPRDRSTIINVLSARDVDISSVVNV